MNDTVQEGSLVIRLTPSGTTIDSKRPVHASKLFHGKNIKQTVQQLPTLFSICATAQASAAVAAAEAALGYQPTAETQAARALLVRVETIRELLWRILLDWPILLQSPPRQQAMSEMIRLQQAFQQQLNTGNTLFQLSPVETIQRDLQPLQERLNNLLIGNVFGMSVQQWQRMESLPELVEWSRQSDTAAAGMVQWIVSQGWESVGHTTIQTLPTLSSAALCTEMAEDHFIEQPQWLGRCYETSAQAGSTTPLMQNLHKEVGNGLLTRTLARLTALAQLAEQLTLQPTDKPVTYSQPCATGTAETARGRLYHMVKLQQEKVIEYRILAPTEWNFHPNGVVTEALNGLQGSRETRMTQANLLIHAIDPCVGFHLELEDA